MKKSNCWYSVEAITRTSHEYDKKKPDWAAGQTLQYFDMRKEAVKFAESLEKVGIRIFIITCGKNVNPARCIEITARTGNGWNLRGMK